MRSRWNHFLRTLFLTGVVMTALMLCRGGLSTSALSGFSPSQYKSPTTYGQGVFYAPESLTLYREPSEQSPIEATLTWSPTQGSLSVQLSTEPLPIRAQSVFVAFYPEAGLALLPVVSYGENNWVEVAYRQDQRDKTSPDADITAWVKGIDPPKALPPGAFNPTETLSEAYPFWRVVQPWTAFFKLNGRRNGLYWLTGVSGYHQAPRTEPDDNASLIQLTAPTKAEVKHVRGNWVLMSYRDFGQRQPIGWVRWRDDEGRLMQFVNFSGQPVHF